MCFYNCILLLKPMPTKYVRCLKQAHPSERLSCDDVVLHLVSTSTIIKLISLDTADCGDKKGDNSFPSFNDSHIICNKFKDRYLYMKGIIWLGFSPMGYIISYICG